MLLVVQEKRKCVYTDVFQWRRCETDKKGRLGIWKFGK